MYLMKYCHYTLMICDVPDEILSLYTNGMRSSLCESLFIVNSSHVHARIVVKLCYSFHRSVFIVTMSEEVLLARVKALEEEVGRLRAQLKEERDGGGTEESLKHQEGEENRSKQKKRGAERPFDFSAHPRRHVALRLAYLGWQYQGFAVQENTDNTVEARLFEALLKTKLVQDRQTSNYHRCGRTDKGVSAFSQVL